MIEFLRPKVEVEEINDNLSRFIVEPLDKGYGDTLGNTMRRVLLNSLTGARATAIKIDGVNHEFTTTDGVLEDVTDIVLNVKGLVFRPVISVANEGEPESKNDFNEENDNEDDFDSKSEDKNNPLGAQDADKTLSQIGFVSDERSYIANLHAEGPCTVTGKDLEVPAEFELINKDHVIAHVADGGVLDMEIYIGVGRGKVIADDNKLETDPIGLIAIDSNFSPVKRCAIKKEDTRVGQHTDNDRLTLEIETDGSITPSQAANRAAYIINQHMDAFIQLVDLDEQAKKQATIFAPEAEKENIELEKRVEDLDLSVRSYNCLKRAEIHTVRSLVEFSERDLLNIRNFGSKSIDEVKAKLISMGLSLKQDLVN